MAEPQVTLDPSTLNPIEEKLRGALEDQLTSALRAATEKTRHEYAGESVDEVVRQLLGRTREGLHPDIAAGFEPDPAELRRVAEAVVANADTRDLPRPR
jgi:L-alanine-DL-glutamate epimerase-like enolase superfamily enzyme